MYIYLLNNETAWNARDVGNRLACSLSRIRSFVPNHFRGAKTGDTDE